MQRGKTIHHRDEQPCRPLAERILLVLYFWVGLSTLIFFWGLNQSRGFDLFHLTWNPTAILSGLALIANGVLLFLLNRIRTKSPAVLWFSLFVSALAAWAFCEIMARSSSAPTQALFWIKLQNIGPAFVPALLLIFTLVYTKNESLAGRASALGILFFNSIFVFYIINATGLTHSPLPSDTAHVWWGYTTKVEPYSPLYIIWVELCFAFSFLLLIKYYLSTRSALIRRQTLWFIWAVAIPVVGGSITDAILPPLLAQRAIPSFAVLLTSIMSSLIAYGIFRFGLFSLNPATLADTILQTMKEAVLVTDNRFTVQFLNYGAESLLGAKEELLQGLDLKRALGTDIFNQIAQSVARTLEKHPFSEIDEGSVHTKAGKKVSVSLSATRAYDETGRPAGYIFVLTNISRLKESLVELQEKTEQLAAKQKELREEKSHVEEKVRERTLELAEAQAELFASIKSLSLGFLLTDQSGATLITNPALEGIFGHHPRQPWSVAEIARQLSPPQALLQKLEICQQEKRSGVLKEINFGSRVLRAMLTPVYAGSTPELFGTVILFEDITESKILERSKDEFFSIVSHELRTPLAAIRGYASLIKESYHDDKLVHMVDTIDTSTKRLISMVNSFLTMSRLEQGKVSFNLAPTDIFLSALEVAGELEPIARAKRLHLQIRKPAPPFPLVTADPDHLKEVFENLIGNALKYTQSGRVVVHFAHKGKTVIVSVEDTGSGIPVEDQRLLFHKFQQANDNILTRDSGSGSGLGLYIVKLIVEAMGGSVALLHSEKNKGSTFAFQLPVAAAPGRAKD